MASFRFELRTNDPDKKGAFRINLVYQHQGRTIFPTGRKIAPQFWNKDSAASWVKPSFGNASVSFNLALKQILNDAEDAVSKFFIANSRYPDRQEIKYLIGKQSAPKTLFALYDIFTAYQTTDRGINNVSHGTYRNYLKVKERLKKFSESRSVKLDFQTITHRFYDDFTAYCTLQGNSEATIGSYVKIIKTFFKWCKVHHAIEITDLVMSTLKVRDVEGFFVFLSIEEFMRWRDLNLAHDPVLDKVRDAAVLQTCLGCRYSDLQMTLLEYVTREESGRYMFRMTTKKTESRVEFPLSHTAVKIMEKYKGINPMDWIPISKTQNKLVKEIAKLAGMFEKTPITKGTGNYRQEVIFQKWQLITTHSFRRTSINLMLLEGMRDVDICAITGQALRTLQRYKQPDRNELEKATFIWDRKPEGDRTGEFKNPEPNASKGEANPNL